MSAAAVTHPRSLVSWRTSAISWVVVLSILGLAAGLRFYRAGVQEIWGDEGAKLEVVTQGVAWLFNPAAEVHPRVFHSLLYLWYGIFGFNAFGLKTLPALAGVLVVAINYAVTLRLLRSRWVACAVAGVTALSPFQVWYSQDLTQYTVLMALVGLSQLSLLHALSAPARVGRWAMVTITSALVVHTHYYGLFALLAQGLGVLLLRRDALKAWLLAELAAAALVAPWLAAQWGLLTGQAAARENFISVERFGQVVWTGLRAFTVGNTAPEIWQWAAWVYLAVALLGLGALWRRDRSAAVSLALWWLVPIPLVFVLTGYQSYFSERFLSMTYLPLAILLVTGLAALGWARLGGLALVGVVALSLTSLEAAYFDPTYTKANYGAMLRLVSERAQPGDVLWLNGPDQRMLFQIYQPTNVSAEWVDRGQLFTDAAADAHLAQLAQGHARVWLVMYGPPPVYDPDHRAETWLSRNGYKAFYQSYLGEYLTLYVLRPPGAEVVTTPVGARFNAGPELIGAAVEPGVVSPGESVLVTLEWRAGAPIELDYTVYTHLLAPDGHLVAQSDSQPVGGTRPMTGWVEGEMVRDQYAIVVPATAVPGEGYSLRVGLYDLATGARATLAGTGDDGVTIGVVQVAAAP